MIGTSELTCNGPEVDQYGRLVAVCTLAGADLGKLMVAQGWAIAFRRYSDNYVPDEVRAPAGDGLAASRWAARCSSGETKVESHSPALLAPEPGGRAASARVRCCRGPIVRSRATAAAAASGFITCRASPITTRPAPKRCSAAKARRRRPDTAARGRASGAEHLGAVGLCQPLHRAARRRSAVIAGMPVMSCLRVCRASDCRAINARNNRLMDPRSGPLH